MSNREKEALIILEAAIEKFDNNESLYIPVEDAKILRDLIKNQENKNEKIEIDTNENRSENLLSKENYSIKEIEPILKIDYVNLAQQIKKHFDKPNTKFLDAKLFTELLLDNTYTIKPKREDVYKCPWCENMSLRVGEFGGYNNPRYKIVCDACEFKMDKNEETPVEAWNTFHNWLIDNDYLKTAFLAGKILNEELGDDTFDV